ncbi:MAG: valyl-tRNA synthetase [Puniceicoccaceae bacterium 5H]|nr:MAG: valyl-tRNA synthetase [Puniceicoccaceae bacterium 5H]
MPDLAKAYDPSQVEDKWYAAWEQHGAFAAHVAPEKQPHTIMIPPPNVTGMLHMGHILNNTLQDIFTRRARLEGKEALWFPGTDHAGIATQTRVERKLRERGQHRRDLGREKFLEEVWQWKEEHGGIILNQLRKLGASCDWSRTSFTLDEGYSQAVLTAFVELYRRGYIYRGLRMSNWCPVSQTALSNEEVIMKPQKGFFYKMRYELVEPATGADGVTRTHLEISTTRPETIMGDTAVAVHPEDERYQHLVGKMIWRPFPREPIPIVADAAVDKEFGTGALKVTPAHDTVDFDIGQRHNLPILDVLNPDGTIHERAQVFVGMDRFEARKAAAQKLDELGLLIEKEPYENNVGFSERADVPIEPRLTMQWWLRYPKVAEAKRAIEAKDAKGEPLLRFHPQRWAKTYRHWLDTMERDNIDWCVSRQLWWGHRIPVWYKKGVDRSALTEADYQNPELVHVSVEGPADPENWEQEEDVLDTWASSWLWPLANFGWPNPQDGQKQELEYFYPTSTLVTGFDIIFLWVARMVMAGLEFSGGDKRELTDAEIAARLPFRDVYITGLIRDGLGRKMSKSLGNSPDPLDLIAAYGADALRYGIVSIAPKGQDIRFEFQPAKGDQAIQSPSVELGRNFCNKLWNACRFRQMSGPAGDNSGLGQILRRIDASKLDRYDHWILHRLIESTQGIADAFARFEMHPYPQELYAFFWSDYCDWYVEASKTKLRDESTRDTVLAILDLCLRQTLQLAEPLMPFIAEELWQELGYVGEGQEFLQDSRLCTAAQLRRELAGMGIALDAAVAHQVEQVKELITQARALKANYNVANRKDVALRYLADDAAMRAIVEENLPTILNLIPAGEMPTIEQRPDGMPATVTSLGTIFLDLASAIDVAAEKERLGKELAKLEKGIKSGEAKLSNDKFVNQAPANVVEGARAQLAETKAKKEEIERLLASLG